MSTINTQFSPYQHMHALLDRYLILGDMGSFKPRSSFGRLSLDRKIIVVLLADHHFRLKNYETSVRLQELWKLVDAPHMPTLKATLTKLIRMGLIAQQGEELVIASVDKVVSRWQ
jgi:hypothetical protein